MRTEDLKLLFKDVSFKPEDIKSYIIDLLSKFEVALMWDEHNLLIPSLLPTEQDLRIGLPQMDIRVSGFKEFLLPPANEVWAKVLFLHLSVILFTGGGGLSQHAMGRGGCLPLGPGWRTPP